MIDLTALAVKGKGRGKGKGKKPVGLKGIYPLVMGQAEAKHWIPEGASIWRGWGSKRWCGHMPPRRRIHAKDEDWGEYEAQKRVIKMLWFQWCHLNGKSIDAVPIKDFITAVEVEEFARI